MTWKIDQASATSAMKVPMAPDTCRAPLSLAETSS